MVLPKFSLPCWFWSHSMTPDLLSENCTPCQSTSLGKSMFLIYVIWSLKSCCLSSVSSGSECCHCSKPLTVGPLLWLVSQWVLLLVLCRQACTKPFRWGFLTSPYSLGWALHFSLIQVWFFSNFDLCYQGFSTCLYVHGSTSRTMVPANSLTP